MSKLASMARDKKREPFARPLHDWEIEEARLVFGESLDYEAIIVHECTGWTNAIDNIGRVLKRMAPRADDLGNALTLGNELFFPIKLPEELIPLDQPDGAVFMPWLIHELTHAWQFQRLGWRYLIMALQAQKKLGAKAYDFDGKKGLEKRHKDGWKLRNFNMEQQGDIAKTYYLAVKRGEDVGAWNPFVEDIKQGKLR